jgi:DNA-binding MarR family transcriptional regulator
MAPRRETSIACVADLEQHVGYMLRRAQISVFADFIGSQSGPVTRPGQFSILIVVGRSPGLSQARVCAALGIKRANLVAAIDDLESQGLVRREASAADRRANRLHLTAAGQRALQKALAIQAAHEARITRLLGAAGRKTLLKQLAQLSKLSAS